jgi:hypothetical protein
LLSLVRGQAIRGETDQRVEEANLCPVGCGQSWLELLLEPTQYGALARVVLIDRYGRKQTGFESGRTAFVFQLHNFSTLGNWS